MHLKDSPRLAFVLVLLAAAGCSTNPDKCYPVRGVIVDENDQPVKELAGGSVTFLPAEEGRGVSSGSIEEDGTFVLSARKPGDGAVAGKHRAQIEVPGAEMQSDDTPRPQPLKLIIDPATAEQEVTVEPKKNNITLKVKRAAPRTR